MDRAAAVLAMRSKGGVMFSKAERDAASRFACTGIARDDGHDGSCEEAYNRIVSNTTFEPVQCREGDERFQRDEPALDPVTCAGRLDSVHGTLDMEATFYRTVGGEVKAGAVTMTDFRKR